MTYKDRKEKYVNSEFRENSIRTRRSLKNGKSGNDNYGVNWKVIKSKEYNARFSKISDDEKVKGLIAEKSRNALKNRDGKNTEELYAISLSLCKKISDITNQHIPFGIKRTKKFNQDVSRAEKKGEKVLLIHNHPRGLPPSLSDLNVLLKNKNVAGITVGHNGSIYYYSRPSKEIPEKDYYVALKKYSIYTEVTSMEKALEELSFKFDFVFRKL